LFSVTFTYLYASCCDLIISLEQRTSNTESCRELSCLALDQWTIQLLLFAVVGLGG
jgi:hypothetical protein